MRYQGLIFDFNGVLWWDNHLHEEAWRQFSVGAGGTALTLEEMAHYMRGRTNRQVMEYALGRAITEDELQRFTEEKETIYRRLCLAEGDAFRLSPGAVELLDFLVARRIPHTIATASERTNVDFFIEHLQLARWFDLDQIIYDDGSRPGKPAPDVYLQAAANLALPPQTCIVVEDSLSGIQAAHDAGIGCIAALGPVERHEQLAQLHGVNLVITSLAELPKERLFLQE